MVGFLQQGYRRLFWRDFPLDLILISWHQILLCYVHRTNPLTKLTLSFLHANLIFYLSHTDGSCPACYKLPLWFRASWTPKLYIFSWYIFVTKYNTLCFFLLKRHVVLCSSEQRLDCSLVLLFWVLIRPPNFILSTNLMSIPSILPSRSPTEMLNNNGPKKVPLLSALQLNVS